jgi:MinD-like ATPase involved in chromosome partitioning or flagellar assembly
MIAARTIVVAGTAGGVGTTTVAALVSVQVQAVELLDHTSGNLVSRGGSGSVSGSGYAVHDLGAHALGQGIASLIAPTAIPVIVTSSTIAGIADATASLRAIVTANPAASPILVVADVFGRHDVSAAARALRIEFGQVTIVFLQQDRALAAGGLIAFDRVSARSRQAIDQVVRRVVAIGSGA